jgi:deazaflavin-dependent oxidoreductase (nitroreductase family)
MVARTTVPRVAPMDKRRITNAAAKYLANPIVERLAGYVPWWALLETIGRRSGKPRRNPVGNGLQGDTFWIVADHGHHADYIKNIMANPRVRVRVGGRWRSGTAHVLPDDDPIERQKQMRLVNAIIVRAVGTDLLTVRIDLDP